MPAPITAAAPRAPLPSFLGAPATAPAPAFGRDAWAPAQVAGAPVQAASVGSPGFLGWLGGALAGAFWALPKLARFGAPGIIGSVVVVLGCGWYGGRVVEGVQALFQGAVRPAAQLGAWFAGGRLAAAAIAGMKQPGALMAAFLIWLGSWAAGKLLDLVWPAGRT